MKDTFDFNAAITRRHFFRRAGMGLGVAALGSLLSENLMGGEQAAFAASQAAKTLAPKAKRIIYLSMIGAPSQLDLFDYKPSLKPRFNEDLGDFLRKGGQRLTGMTSGQAKFPVAPSIFKFAQHGKSGTWVSELLPWTSKMVDELCIIKSMHTEAINHEPANQLIFTGNMQAGKASIGSWMSYGLGSLNKDLPTFVVLHAQHSSPHSNVQAISSRLWGAGFLPGQHAGVTLRTKGDPVLFLRDAPGIDRDLRRKMLDGLNDINRLSYEAVGDPETQVRIQQYEMAFSMQASVPELSELKNEPKTSTDLYGPDALKDGTFANCALLARRLAERGVRFVQVFHRGWDSHENLPRDLASQCKDIDQACWGLIQDLKQRGMLEDTLVVWGGEFGRTAYCQGALTATNYGRDHHPRCFTLWMAGAGVKPGYVHGETDELSYDIVKDPVHIRDLHATILNQIGLDHQKFHFRYQGLDQRLTGVEHAKVIKELLV